MEIANPNGQKATPKATGNVGVEQVQVACGVGVDLLTSLDVRAPTAHSGAIELLRAILSQVRDGDAVIISKAQLHRATKKKVGRKKAVKKRGRKS